MAGVRVDILHVFVIRAIALCLALGLAMRADAQVLGPPPVNRLSSTGPSITTGPRAGSLPASSSSGLSGAGGAGSYVPVTPKEQLVDTPIDPLVEQNVVEIRVVGNETRPTAQILTSISTRVDRPFDQTMLEKDVRTLATKKWFLDVRPIREQVAGGVRITFEVIERPTLLYVKYLGNTKIRDKRLAKETDLKRGSSLDPYAVEDGRRKIEEYYKSKGYNDARVTVLEGTKPGDRGAIYMIDEGQAQKIKVTKFVGNTVTSGQRLKTQIESKPPILWVFKGQYNEQKVNEDIDKLISYYRSLGFFRAQVSREPIMDDKWKKVELTFVINEGPRYKVRGVAFIGNRKFSREQLGNGMALKEGEYFVRRNLDQDITRIQDVYGTQGYVFANVQQELRFEEEPGELTVVFSVEEGSRYAVGEIKIHIAGDTPHTRFNAVLNRLMFHPGDVINTQKIRNAERRLKASGLFVNDPSKGQLPKITFSPPGEEEETGVADRPQGGPGGRTRGQSPDNGPDVQKLDMHVYFASAREADEFIKSNPDLSLQSQEALLDSSAAAPEPPREKSSWWPFRSRSAPAEPARSQRTDAPKWAPQSSMALPPLDLAADEVLIVRGQGPSDAVGRAGSDGAAATPPSQTSALANNATSNGPPASPAGSAAAGRQSAAPPASKGFATAITSLNLTAPVSLGQSLFTARNGSTQPAAKLPAANASAASGPAAGVPSAAQAPLATAGRGGSASTPADGAWTVRGQSQFGGRLLQPLSPGPQSPPAYASGANTSAYGGNVAFQSPGGGTLPPPQFRDPLPGMPTDPTAPEEPEEVLPTLPINVTTQETQTGKFMFGVGVNSNAGLVGSIVVDEQNFDWAKWPTGAESWRNGTAFRGRGQHFRIELAPGTQMSRYLVSFNNPYLLDTNVSYGMSAYYFQRFYYDWYEQRMGGKVNLGYQFRPDLVGTVGIGAENVRIEDPRILIPDLAQVLGNNGRFSMTFAASNDTRDNTFFPTEGRYINVAYEQVTGSFTYPRLTLDMRKYFVLHQRADGSGRQVLALYSYTGVTGANTPIYDRFFLGGIGTIRGFYYRDASPTFDTVLTGGDFASYGTIEYTVPITADDMFRLAFFVDGGFDARTSDVSGSDIRIAPGIGIRVSVPAMGPAPIAVDFAFPVVKNAADQNQVVNFAVGVAR